MSFKGKKVLITAGPTWVAIDSVRVLSNISSGATGIALARQAVKRGLKTTLLLGPVGEFKSPLGIRLIRFEYFKELEHSLKNLLAKERFDLIFHLAAVSDYRPVSSRRKKLSSEHKLCRLKLVPTPKLARLFKKFCPDSFLVLFKLQDSDRPKDFRLARKTLQANKANLIVLNVLNKYRAHIINSQQKLSRARSKSELTHRLFKVVADQIKV